MRIDKCNQFVIFNIIEKIKKELLEIKNYKELKIA